MPHRPKSWDHGKSRHERGYGAAWTRLRAFVLTRDKHLCQPCRRNRKTTPAVAVDHIVPKARGGTDDLDNLQAICTACHAAKTRIEARGAGQRMARPDGWRP